MIIFRLFSHKSLVPWRFFIKDKLIWISFFIAAVFNILIWLLLYFKMPHGEELLPLHYNIYFGIDKFGKWYEIFLVSGIGAFIFFFNFLLAYLVYKKEKFLSYFLAVMAALSQLILTVASMVVVLANI